jgi:predicted RNA-binding protein with RPS1 domain
MLDPEETVGRLPDGTELWVVTRADHGWQLTEALPDGLDVYGGGVRVWWPIPDLDRIDPREHPVFTIYGPADAQRAASEVVRHVVLRSAQPPEPGDVADGIVTAVFAHGAEFEFGPGFSGFAANEHLANGRIYRGWEAVQEGQPVRLQVNAVPPRGRDTYQVSLRPFAPEPWERLAEVYQAGMDVEGVVVRIERYGAFVELLPGAQGLVPIKGIAREYVVDIADYVAIDDRVVVHIKSLDPGNRRAELSLTDVPADADVQTPPSVYPDGPPWLTELQSVDESPEDKWEYESLANESPTTELAPEQLQEHPVDEPDLPGTDVEDSASAVAELGVERLASSRHDVSAEIVDLVEASTAATTVREELRADVAAAERELAEIREAARRVAADLRHVIHDAQVRVRHHARDDTDAALGAAHGEIESLRDQVYALDEQLAHERSERRTLIARVGAERSKRREADETIRLERERAERAEAQLQIVDGGDPARRFTRELHATWSELYTTDQDRRRHPFGEPIIGPTFLASVANIEGIEYERILKVCAHVVAGRAHEINSLALHQLRSSSGGDAPVVIRDDGAMAWRVNLQTGTSSARRLHYWQLRDGRIELSKVGTHDDLSIA